MRAKRKPHFLNVDLDIESTSKLDSLAAVMGKRVIVLHSGPVPKTKRHLLALESSRWHLRNPDAAIQALCSVVESLSPASRRLWQKAWKEFDVGYEFRPSERALRFSLRPDTIARVAALGANLTVTCYRGD